MLSRLTTDQRDLAGQHVRLACYLARRPLYAALGDEGESIAAVALLKAAQTFDPARGPFGPWAARTIRRDLLRAIRKAKRQACVSLTDIEQPADEQAARVASLDVAEQIASAVEALPERQRHVVRRRHWDGAGLAEIGAEPLRLTGARVGQLLREASGVLAIELAGLV